MSHTLRPDDDVTVTAVASDDLWTPHHLRRCRAYLLEAERIADLLADLADECGPVPKRTLRSGLTKLRRELTRASGALARAQRGD